MPRSGLPQTCLEAKIVTAAELQEHCKSRLQRFQYPHLIEFVPELPKTVTGKIQRYKLREKEAAPA
ncbi:MAG: hypothetical protein E6I41_09580 [Chloroflexi bacterium]|nr:MAG: hypothetical protein E6I41_09580 [Chloroflexota bacterium]